MEAPGQQLLSLPIPKSGPVWDSCVNLNQIPSITDGFPMSMPSSSARSIQTTPSYTTVQRSFHLLTRCTCAHPLGRERGGDGATTPDLIGTRNYCFNFLFHIMIVCDDKTPGAALFYVSSKPLRVIHDMGSDTLPCKINYCGTNLYNDN